MNKTEQAQQLRLAAHIIETGHPFEFYDGKEWTWHRPGDPMPCDGHATVEVLYADGGQDSSGKAAHIFDWGMFFQTSCRIIGWRYAETTKQVPLGPEDLLPGSWLKFANGPSALFAITEVRYASVVVGADQAACKSYGELYDGFQINRSIPLTGKWDANAWEPCSKEVQA
jgi:hypothetical protein